ncbi:hypothetical protein ACHAO7_009403 [Fusarium culmorum]
MFPQSDSAVVVLVNSIALSDAANWIARVMIKSLFNLEDDPDYMTLAKEANSKAIEEYRVLGEQVDNIKAS